MTIAYTAAQVRLMLRIIAHTLPELRSFAAASGERPGNIDGMIVGALPVSSGVLKALDLTRQGSNFLWRVR